MICAAWNGCHAATRTDAARLEDLNDEAEFFAFDALAAACTEAVDALVEDPKRVLHIEVRRGG